jgi:beta-lactamase regulating signal transducer with metallopeptidase domain
MSLLILRGLLLTVEALVISALLPLISWAVGAFFRRNAARRHLVWLAVFGIMIALPLLALLVPPRVMALPSAPPVPVDIAMAAPVTATYAHTWSIEAIIAIAAAPLCALWLIGVAWNLLRLALGAHGLWRMRRASTAFDRVGDCDVRLGNSGPLTFGVLKPVIILPYDAPRWSRERREAVLRHELAHVARRDSLTQWLAALACAFYWINPLVWVAAKALRRDAEMAADDAVLASGVQASLYAAELVRLAADTQGARFAVAMASPSSLEARVTSVLSPNPSRAGVTPMDALKLALLGGACAVALAFARPDIALAQTPAPAAPLATPAAPDAPMPPVRQAHTVHHSDAGDRVIVTDTVTIDDNGNRTERHTRHTMTGAEHAQIEAARQQAEGAREQAQAAREMAHEQAQAAREQAHAQAEAAREQAHAHAEVAREQAQAQADVAREQAQVMRANAHASAEGWRQASAQIRQAVAQAMADIRPYIREASRDPQSGERISAKVNETMARVQPQIDAAIARANAHAYMSAPPPPVAPMAPLAPPAPPASPAPL